MKGLENIDERELARNAQAGSLLSYEELVRRYEQRIFAYLMSRCNRRQDAEDLLQQTFIAAYRNIGKYKAEYAFSPWLYTIARNLSVSHFRKQRPQINEVFDFTDERSPDHLLAEREARDNLWAIVRRELPEIQSTALWLKYSENMQVTDIAQAIDKSTTHTKVILYRARKNLAKAVAAVPAADLRPPPLPETRPVFAEVSLQRSGGSA